jgi:hypothetical protein
VIILQQARSPSAVPQIAGAVHARGANLSPMARCCSSTAASLVSRASYPSARPRATRAGRAAIGSKPSVPIGSINAGRWRIFEGPRKPELTEAQKTLAKKREELARVRASLARPGLRPGLAVAVKAQEQALLQEIAEIEELLSVSDGTQPYHRS